MRWLFAGVLLGAALIGSAAAQTYPDKAIQLVVPYDPGGVTDLMGRQVAKQLSEALGQPVVVENRTGAAGLIGAQHVAKARPDGYTLLYDSVTQRGTSAALEPGRQPFDFTEAFKPIAVMVRSPRVLAIGASVPAKTLQEFVELAKSKDTPLTYSSSGIGSAAHLSAELFQIKTGTKLEHVPYNGAAGGIPDIVGGHVDATFTPVSGVIPQVHADTMRALAVSSSERIPELPDVPTFEEAGVPGFEISSIYGVFAPAGLPDDIAERLSSELQKIAQSEEFKTAARVQGGGALAISTDLDAAHAMVADEMAKWKQAVDAAGLKPAE